MPYGPWYAYLTFDKAIEMSIFIYAAIAGLCSDLHILVKASGLAGSCIKLLKPLSQMNNVKVLWVLGHFGVTGNGIICEIARISAARPL